MSYGVVGRLLTRSLHSALGHWRPLHLKRLHTLVAMSYWCLGAILLQGYAVELALADCLVLPNSLCPVRGHAFHCCHGVKE